MYTPYFERHSWLQNFADRRVLVKAIFSEVEMIKMLRVHE